MISEIQIRILPNYPGDVDEKQKEATALSLWPESARVPPNLKCPTGIDGGYARFLTAVQKASVIAELPSGSRARPTTKGGGAGESGRTIKRRPERLSNPCCTKAIPLPASTEAIRLVELSCSSATVGGRKPPAKSPLSQE